MFAAVGFPRARRCWIVGSAVAVLFGALAACGNDDDDRVTKADYIKAADQACGRYERQLDALTDPTSQDAAAIYLEKVLAISEKRLDELAKLRLPERDAGRVTAVFSSYRSINELVGKQVVAVKAGDSEQYQSLADDARTAAVDLDDEAQSIGFARCGKPDELKDLDLAALIAGSEDTDADFEVPADTEPAVETDASADTAATEETLPGEEADANETTLPEEVLSEVPDTTIAP